MSNPNASPEVKPSETPQREADCPAPSGYQLMAALSCDLIDLLAQMASEDKTMTADELRGQIADIKGQKDELIADPEKRERRYAAALAVYSLANDQAQTSSR